MKNTYYLEIVVENDDILLVDKILGIQHNTDDCRWQLLIEEEEASIDFITFFMDVLEGKYDALEEIGVARNKIVIWHIYEYDWQCNFEYSPAEMKRLGDNGITLCVSCWDSGKEPVLRDKVLN